MNEDLIDRLLPMSEAPASGEEILAVDSNGDWRVVFFSWETDGVRYFQHHGGPARGDYTRFMYLPELATK